MVYSRHGLMIAAERLELSFLCGSRSRLLPFIVAMMGAAVFYGDPRWIGLSWALLAVWLGLHDLARRNAFRQGLAAFSARAVLSGYVWLVYAGGRVTLQGFPYSAGPAVDAILHSVFVGFVLSMVMAHGPIIFPALWKSSMTFTRWFYLPLLILHAGLFCRIFLNRDTGALLNILALGLYAITLLLHRSRGKNLFLRS